MEIRDIERKDIKAALDLVWNVFLEFEAPQYVQAGVQEFKDFISLKSILKMYDTGEIRFWGCYDNKKLAGVIATKEINHICLLFVSPQYHRKGIARNLFKTVLDSITDKNIKSITVNSSPYAVDVYHKLGFTDLDSEKTVNGIRFTPMVNYIKETNIQ